MSKRGLSREEKRTRMVEIFTESSEFFTLKELEKIAPSPEQKGIVQQTVKEILDEVVGDNLVVCDKIGTSNYYWSFPSTAGATKQNALDKANAEADGLEAQIGNTLAAIKAATKGREDTADRHKLVAELEAARAESDKLKAELEAYGAADPVRYARKKEAIAVAKGAALRWTDNTMILWSLAKNASPIFEDEPMREALGISETWEDLEVS